MLPSLALPAPYLLAHTSWYGVLAVAPVFIEPGSPWENVYVESFNGKMRDELRAKELFYTLDESQVLAERWHRQYNTQRPHRALGYRPPAPETRTFAPVSGGLTTGGRSTSGWA